VRSNNFFKIVSILKIQKDVHFMGEILAILFVLFLKTQLAPFAQKRKLLTQKVILLNIRLNDFSNLFQRIYKNVFCRCNIVNNYILTSFNAFAASFLCKCLIYVQRCRQAQISCQNFISCQLIEINDLLSRAC